MELDVTEYVNTVDCSLFSASRAETGLDDIAERTWRAAQAHVSAEPIVPPDAVGNVIDWLEGFGAWTRDELEFMGDVAVNALLLQFIAGDIREMESYDSPEEYDQATREGAAGGRLFQGDDGRWFFYVGN